MMNFDIKRKINNLRDILVGKVPDPKAQVEQITIALIYKFMDDMDQKEVAIYEMLSDILWLPEKHYNDFMLLLMWLEREVYRY